MSSIAILIDFGSTYTKVVAVDLRTAEVIGRSQAPSTVLTDVREGLLRALIRLHEQYGLFDSPPAALGVLRDRVVFASSSAAGGLKMAVIGLVPGLTVEAANLAALGAGAKVVGSWGFKIKAETIREIETRQPDMILLTGGTDRGDSATILHNARLLAGSALAVPIIVAGNQSVAGGVCEILAHGGKEARSAANVMPRSGELAVESAREEIRKLFMERITRAKGLEGITEFVPVTLPTPMAALRGAVLGAAGTAEEPGWGDLLVIDVGGATTDVHSVGYGEPSGPQIAARGLPEPLAKRTVEGDLGIRFNAGTLLERIGIAKFAIEFRAGFPQFAVSAAELRDYIDHASHETACVPLEDWQRAADAQLARVAVDLAVERHVGRKERIVAREGAAWIYSGKDLSETPTVIGTGGVFVYNPHVAYILDAGTARNSRPEVLRPKKPRVFVDSSYVLYVVGLLAESYPNVAACLFRRHMVAIDHAAMFDRRESGGPAGNLGQ